LSLNVDRLVWIVYCVKNINIIRLDSCLIWWTNKHPADIANSYRARCRAWSQQLVIV